MRAALPEVPEQHRVHAVLADEAAEVPQEVAEALRRHPGVFPRRQAAVLAGDARVLAAAAADLPYFRLVPRVLEYPGMAGVQAAHRGLSSRVGFLLGISAVLGKQPGSAGRELVDPRGVLAVLVDVVDDALVEAFKADEPRAAEQAGN